MRKFKHGGREDISIHAPREGSDHDGRGRGDGDGEFQSTLPVRGATFDSLLLCWAGSRFQSTLPVRGATWPGFEINSSKEFQSTLPVRGATHQEQTHQKEH